MDKNLEEIKLGEEASNVLNNPAFKRALDSVKGQIIQSLEQVPFGDEKTQNKLVISLQVLNQIEKQLTYVMQTGKLATIERESLLQKAKKVFR